MKACVTVARLVEQFDQFDHNRGHYHPEQDATFGRDDEPNVPGTSSGGIVRLCCVRGGGGVRDGPTISSAADDFKRSVLPSSERREWAPLVEARWWRLWRQPWSRAYLQPDVYALLRGGLQRRGVGPRRLRRVGCSGARASP